jgi:NAD(P)-dependent dehydrogenase (short-subunit alcohol dehydrogenase family)
VQLAGRCALVTGAGSGLGRAVAEDLHAVGARVLLADVDRHGLADALAALGNGIATSYCDVRDPGLVSAALDLAKARFGSVRILVNCAGVASSAKIASHGTAHDLELWRRVIDVNLTGTFNAMRLAVEQMLKNDPDEETGERGVIVNTASIAAFEGQRGQAAYAASKAGVLGLTLPVARDLADKAIRCVAVAPGLFATPLLQGIPRKGVESLQRALLYPARMGQPAEFAAAVRHLIENPYFNGTCLRLDGGGRLPA